MHQQYNSGGWIIVELYSSKEEAQEGHSKWVKIMTDKKLPEELKDVGTSEIAEFAKGAGCEFKYKRNK